MPPTILRGHSHQASRSVLHSKEAPPPEGRQLDDVETPLETRTWFVDAIPLQIGRFDGMTEFLNPTGFARDAHPSREIEGLGSADRP
jgi:hypothetical protein